MYRAIFLIGTLIAMLFCETSALSSNLIKNGDFEANDSAWKFDPAEKGAVVFDKQEKHSGRSSLKISHKLNTSYSKAIQVINVKPNTNYAASGFIKTMQVNKAANGFGSVFFIGDSSGNAFAASGEYTGTRDWERFNFSFNSQAQTQLMLIPYLHNSSGTVWFDDVEISEVVSKPVINSDAIPLDLSAWELLPAGPQAITKDDSVKFKGHGTIKFDHPAFAASNMKITVKVKPDTNYFVAAQLKSECPYLRERGFAGLRLLITDQAGTWLACTQPQTAIADWREAGFAFNSGNRQTVDLKLDIADGDGKSWIGDISMREITNPAELGDVTPKYKNIDKLIPDNHGYAVFANNPVDVFFSTRAPEAGEIARQLNIQAAGNQQETAAFAVYALKPLKQVKVEILDDLKNADGKIISRDNIEIRYASPDKFNLDSLRYWVLPVFLRKNGKTDIPAGRNLRYFAKVTIPVNTVPGDYSTKIRISAGNAPTSEISLNLKVYPFTLPESDVPFIMYHNTELEPRILADMSRHGMNSVTVYDSAAVKDGKLCNTALPQVIGDMKGLYNKNLPLLYLYCNNKDWLATFCPPLQTIKTLKKEQIEKGWPELLIYCVDEPNSLERIAEARQALKKIKAACPNVRTITAIGRDGLKAGLADLYDILILDSMDMTPELMKQVKERHDKEWLLYECRLNGKTPAVDRYAAGFFSYAMGTKGLLQWVYSDPNRDKDSGAGIVYGYVLIEKDDLVPSIGWEGKREGVDDYRYIQLLNQLLKQADLSKDVKVIQTAAAARKLLEDIKSMIDPESLSKRLTKQDGVTFRLDNKQQDNLSAAQYGLWRQKIAEHIIQLQTLLNK